MFSHVFDDNLYFFYSQFPTTPSSFIDSAFDALIEKLHGFQLTEDQKTALLQLALEKALQQYGSWVFDLLEAVRRMEDSLKKLKKSRQSSEVSVGASDDDKIREQLALDVIRTKDQVKEGESLSQLYQFFSRRSEWFFLNFFLTFCCS